MFGFEISKYAAIEFHNVKWFKQRQGVGRSWAKGVCLAEDGQQRLKTGGLCDNARVGGAER